MNRGGPRKEVIGRTSIHHQADSAFRFWSTKKTINHPGTLGEIDHFELHQAKHELDIFGRRGREGGCRVPSGETGISDNPIWGRIKLGQVRGQNVEKVGLRRRVRQGDIVGDQGDSIGGRMRVGRWRRGNRLVLAGMLRRLKNI